MKTSDIKIGETYMVGGRWPQVGIALEHGWATGTYYSRKPYKATEGTKPQSVGIAFAVYYPGAQEWRPDVIKPAQVKATKADYERKQKETLARNEQYTQEQREREVEYEAQFKDFQRRLTALQLPPVYRTSGSMLSVHPETLEALLKAAEAQMPKAAPRKERCPGSWGSISVSRPGRNEAYCPDCGKVVRTSVGQYRPHQRIVKDHSA
jgi:hypothetical protein